VNEANRVHEALVCDDAIHVVVAAFGVLFRVHLLTARAAQTPRLLG